MRKHDIGKALEKRIAKSIGGKRTIGSGNLWFDKEDVKNSEWLIQTKATDKEFYNLKSIDIKKLIVNSKKTHRKWAFVIEFNSSNILKRKIFVGIDVNEAEQILDADLMYGFEDVKGKQIKIKVEDMESNWLTGDFVLYSFKRDKIDICFISDEDFLGYIGVK